MKHLKKFNEALIDPERYKRSREITEFCDTYLAYLSDSPKSFKSGVDGSPDRYYRYSLFTNFNGLGTREFSWSEVKDYFIPFMHAFIDEYKMYDKYIIFSRGREGASRFTIDQLLNDEIPNEEDISNINFYIANE